MKGIIVGFRRSRTRIYYDYAIIKVENVNSKEEARKLIGKKVKVGDNLGVIVNVHGNKGKVRAKFKRGLHPESIGKEVEINV